MITIKVEEVTDQLFIGNDEIGYVNLEELCEDLNISGENVEEDITEEVILMYKQMNNRKEPMI